MAAIGFIFGSVIGLAVAIVAWLGFGAAVMTGLGLYLGFGVAGGLLTLLTSNGDTPPLVPMGQVVSA